MLWRDPTPPEVRDRMRDIFNRPEFQRSKNPVQRLWERFMDWLSRHFSPDIGGTSWGGPIGQLVVWTALVLLLIGLAVIIYRVVRSRRPRRSEERAEATVSIEDERDAAEWAGAAADFEARGEWKEAIRCRYRELVTRLVDDGVVSSSAGRTTGELRADVAAAAPEVSDAFDEATLLFELPWYAHQPTDAADNQRFRTLATTVTDHRRLAGAAS
ncbi:MAG: DUF4129 domain-containing protein [Acidimicrobiales bacterium]